MKYEVTGRHFGDKHGPILVETKKEALSALRQSLSVFQKKISGPILDDEWDYRESQDNLYLEAPKHGIHLKIIAK